jgi:septal ring factor EnvC (AmiA/AmiB activator)
LNGRRFFKKLAAAVLSLAIVFSVSAGKVPVKAASMDQLRSKQSALKQQQKKYESQIAKLKNDKAKQVEYKNTLDSQIKGLEDLIDNEQEQIDTLNAEILQKEQEISDKEAEIKADFQRLKQRVYALYLTGEASNLEIILNAKNIMDLADKAEILRAISKHDNDLMNQLRTNINSIQEQKKQIEQDRKEASAKKTDLESNRSLLKQKSAEVQKVIAEISKNQSQAEAAKAQVEEEYQATTEELEAAIAKFNAMQEKQQQQSTSGGTSGGQSGSTSGGQSGGTSGGSTTSYGGKFVWPVPGYMRVSTDGHFGWRDGNSDYHYGIDIVGSGIYGAAIVAAADGTVYDAEDHADGAFYGFGTVVVIYHGGGLATIYGHMSRRAVSEGAYVKAGDVIGYVGSSGEKCDGTHLHFEVRDEFPAIHVNKNGKHINGIGIDPKPYVGVD